LRCRLWAEGADIVTLDGHKLATKHRTLDWPRHTMKDDQFLGTCTYVRAEIGISMSRGGVAYTLGDHPIADELRPLDIDGKALQHI
jgi:hypothetical protein